MYARLFFWIFGDPDRRLDALLRNSEYYSDSARWNLMGAGPRVLLCLRNWQRAVIGGGQEPRSNSNIYAASHISKIDSI